MKEPRELELKYHLEEKSDYALMVEGCPPAHGLPPVKQENHYFDSARYDLARRGGMLRLRFDGNLTLGFKLGSEQPGCPGFFDALEVECPTDPGLLQRALKDPRVLSELELDPIRSLKEHCGNISLTGIGHLSTTRRYRMLQEFLLELDEVIYDDGGGSYELEIETSSPQQARRLLLLKFKQLSVNARPQHLSKLQALLQRSRIDIPGEDGCS